MPIAAAAFQRARKFDRQAVELVIDNFYPATYRIAHAISGRPDVAAGIIRFVILRAIEQLPTWPDADSAERWFYHFTVLTARRPEHQKATIRDDCLIGPNANLAYIAFVRGLRALPFQQREAILLNHGEKLDLRPLAVAMDCSTHAAAQHLEAATTSLKSLAGGAYPELLAQLKEVYAYLLPPEELSRPPLRRLISRRLKSRRLKRLARILLPLIALLAIAYVVWRWRLWGFEW